MIRTKFRNIPKLLLVLAVPIALCAGLVPLAAQTASAEPLMIAAATTTTPCYSCGTITKIKAHKKKHRNTRLGLITGAIVGGVVGHNVGHGDSATAAGAVVGGYAGNEIEKNNRGSTTTYSKVYVRMNYGGGTQTVNVRSAQGLHVGQRVRVRNGNIIVR